MLRVLVGLKEADKYVHIPPVLYPWWKGPTGIKWILKGTTSLHSILEVV